MNRVQIITFIAALLFLLFLFSPSRMEIGNYFFEKGNYYFSVGAYNLNKAQKRYEWALKIYPQAQGPHYQLARIYFLKGDFGHALDEINIEIKNFPDFKRSHYVRGLINGYAKNFPAAITDFEEFLEWDSKSWAAHNDLAWIYFQKGDYKKAEEVSRRGLGFSSDSPWLLNSLGTALLNLGKKQEAKTAFEAALNEAKKLTPSAWQKAYPGNNPAIAEGALKRMLENIEFNWELAR